ncbi:MAG: hypothetical protein U0625_00235 [Phycisphaerales bacterium]
MQPTPFQLRALKIYREYHANGYSVARGVRLSVRGWFVIVIVAGGLSALLAMLSPVGAALCVGMLLGALLRDLRALVTAKRLWPVTREIIDWSRVDALIGDRS